MLALTINLPDWLFNGPFWLGFVCGAVLVALVVLWLYFSTFDLPF